MPTGIEETIGGIAGTIAVATAVFAVGSGIYMGVNKYRKQHYRIYSLWREIQETKLRENLLEQKKKITNSTELDKQPIVEYQDVKKLGSSPLAFYRLFTEVESGKRWATFKAWASFSWSKVFAWRKACFSPLMKDILSAVSKAPNDTVKGVGKAAETIFDKMDKGINTFDKIASDNTAVSITDRMGIPFLQNRKQFSKDYDAFRKLMMDLSSEKGLVVHDEETISKLIAGEKLLRYELRRANLEYEKTIPLDNAQAFNNELSSCLENVNQIIENLNDSATPDSGYLHLSDGRKVMTATDKALERSQSLFFLERSHSALTPHLAHKDELVQTLTADFKDYSPAKLNSEALKVASQLESSMKGLTTLIQKEEQAITDIQTFEAMHQANELKLNKIISLTEDSDNLTIKNLTEGQAESLTSFVQSLDMNDLKELFPSEYASESTHGVQAKRKLSLIKEGLVTTVEQYQTSYKEKQQLLGNLSSAQTAIFDKASEIISVRQTQCKVLTRDERLETTTSEALNVTYSNAQSLLTKMTRLSEAQQQIASHLPDVNEERRVEAESLRSKVVKPDSKPVFSLGKVASTLSDLSDIASNFTLKGKDWARLAQEACSQFKSVYPELESLETLKVDEDNFHLKVGKRIVTEIARSVDSTSFLAKANEKGIVDSVACKATVQACVSFAKKIPEQTEFVVRLKERSKAIISQNQGAIDLKAKQVVDIFEEAIKSGLTAELNEHAQELINASPDQLQRFMKLGDSGISLDLK